MNILKKLDDNDLIGKSLRIALSFYPYKYRKLKKPFAEFTNLLLENERKSFKEMQHYQFDRFRSIVKNANNHSIFYKKHFRENNFSISDLKNISDIDKVPILRKQDIKDCYKDLILDTYKGKIYSSVTSGTTGSPLTILRDKETSTKEWASICYQWMRIGYKPKDGRIELRGLLNKGEIVRNINYDKVLRVNIIEMSSLNIEFIYMQIVKSENKFLHGYPSAIVKFFKTLIRKGMSLPPNIEGVFLASEILYDWQIDFIKEFCPTKVKIIAHYGQAEKIALGAWNEDEKYHFIPTYSLVEKGKNNSIIGTSFINDNIPLIRYQMNDVVEDFVQRPENNNKSLFPIVGQIKGRLEDVTYTNDELEVPPAIVTFPFKNLITIKACRIIQLSFISFRIEYQTFNIMDERILDKELKHLKESFVFIYGNKSKIEFIKKDNFTDLKNGKFRWIINKMK